MHTKGSTLRPPWSLPRQGGLFCAHLPPGILSFLTCRVGFWNGGVGCSIEVLAELMGDTPKVAFDHYGREWGQHYQAPLWRAIGVGESD